MEPSGGRVTRGSRLTVWVRPRARRTEITGRHGDAVKIRLAAPPVEGAANDELIRFLAARLGVARSAVRLLTGRTARRKLVAIDGLRAREVEERLARPY